MKSLEIGWFENIYVGVDISIVDEGDNCEISYDGYNPQTVVLSDINDINATIECLIRIKNNLENGND